MQMAELPNWTAMLTSVLVLVGAGLTLIGSLGLLRFKSFYERVHAPTLGSTLGAGAILIASAIYFSVLQTRLVLHEVLIAIFMTVTTPVTLMLLVRAALHRDWSEGSGEVTRDRRSRTVDDTRNQRAAFLIGNRNLAAPSKDQCRTTSPRQWPTDVTHGFFMFQTNSPTAIEPVF